MKRFWVSWWTRQDATKELAFDYWVSGWRFRPGTDGDIDDSSICALIDAESEDSIWEEIMKCFPDAEPRFCEEKPADYSPGDRFPGGGRTSLV